MHSRLTHMLAPKRLLGMLLVAAMVTIAGAACSEGLRTSTTPSILFSAIAQDTTISMTSSDTGTLTASSSTPMLWFTDRPARESGSMTLAEFVAGWTVNGFDVDPPNAALVITTPEATTQHVVVLESPLLNGDRITFRITVDADGSEMGRTHLHDIASGRFDHVELFIDDAGYPECPDYLTAKEHSVFKCIISTGETWKVSQSFDQAGLNGSFQLCAVTPGLSIYGDFGIPNCPGQVEIWTYGPWGGAATYNIEGKPSVLVTATFHGRARAPKPERPNTGPVWGDGAEGPSD